MWRRNQTTPVIHHHFRAWEEKPQDALVLIKTSKFS